MTAPVRPLVKSLDGRSARELYAIERTVDNGGEAGPPIIGRSDNSGPYHFVTEAGGFYVIGTHPAASTWLDDTGHWLVPSQFFTHITAWAHVVVAGFAGSVLDVEYTTDGGVSWAATGIAIPLDALGPHLVSSPLPAGANNASTVYRGVAVGGNDSASPELYNFAFALRSQTPEDVTPVTPGDLPEGPPWGNIVWRVKANGPNMQALGYADNADVPNYPDETANGNDMTTAASPKPTYKATGFNGSHPCVEWSGANVPLTTANNPTAPYGSYTYYFALEALDGGDVGLIWGAGFTDSFQYGLYATSNQIQAANNNLFGSPALFATDDWDMSTAHLYRYVKDPLSSSQHLFVDGVLKASATAAPQTNNPGTAEMMNFLTGLGMTGRMAEGVAYDLAHVSPTNTTGSTPVDGKTLPEEVLSTMWGL
jgi:hypothetical protein